jgi:hypothetical protein
VHAQGAPSERCTQRNGQARAVASRSPRPLPSVSFLDIPSLTKHRIQYNWNYSTLRTAANSRATIELVLGGGSISETSSFGVIPTLRSALQILRKEGIAQIDTAHMYGDSEELLGQAEAGEKFTIDSMNKGGFEPGSAKRSGVIDEVDLSLKKLKIEKLGIFYIHALVMMSQSRKIYKLPTRSSEQLSSSDSASPKTQPRKSKQSTITARRRATFYQQHTKELLRCGTRTGIRSIPDPLTTQHIFLRILSIGWRLPYQD